MNGKYRQTTGILHYTPIGIIDQDSTLLAWFVRSLKIRESPGKRRDHFPVLESPGISLKSWESPGKSGNFTISLNFTTQTFIFSKYVGKNPVLEARLAPRRSICEAFRENRESSFPSYNMYDLFTAISANRSVYVCVCDYLSKLRSVYKKQNRSASILYSSRKNARQMFLPKIVAPECRVEKLVSRMCQRSSHGLLYCVQERDQHRLNGSQESFSSEYEIQLHVANLFYN